MPYCRAEQSSHATRGERWRFNQGVTLLQREKEKRQAGPGQRDDVYSYKWNNWNEFVATDLLDNGPPELPPSHHSRRHAVALADSITTQADCFTNCGSAG